MQLKNYHDENHADVGVVISGISGRFPESNDLEEFWSNLVQGVDMVSEESGRRLHVDGVPTRKGTLTADLTKFDASFFGVHPKQAERMDPQFRTLHEVTWEAIMDAGVNPVTLRGTRVGVFVGTTQTQTHYASLKSSNNTSAYDTTGSFGGMAANRISYAYDFKGPSYTVDTLCSSSMLALHNALQAIRAGECDAAVVGGVNVNFHPGLALQIQKSGALSPDGKCKSYDAAANGYVRGEAIVAVFIQKRLVARRAYATLVASATNSDGFTLNGISSPSEEDQMKLMRQLYGHGVVGIDINKIFYIEGHGTGTAAGDPAELNAISSILLASRGKDQPPILVGSVKSNMGHSEAASGLCSVAKVVLALQHGLIPANLHFQKPNPSIPALLDGRLKVVCKNTSIEEARTDRGLIVLNSFGFGGSNVQVLLESIGKAEDQKCVEQNDVPKSANLSNLVLFSGVTEESVRFALEKVQSSEHYSSFEYLLNGIAKTPVPGHRFRGYAIGQTDINVQSLPVDQEPHPAPLWYIFSGMGTVYRGMFDDLLEIPQYAASIDACNEILSQFGLNVQELSRSPDDGPINQNMGVLYGAMLIGLIDTMEALGFRPAGMIGHSAGELSCGYADKGLTREQLLCILHHKDVCILNCSGGSMAAVGMTWEEARARCPAGIYPACHNDEKSVTIAGPVEPMTKFVEKLKQEGVFARTIDTGGVSYHSPYLGPILPAYETAVRKELAKTGDEKKTTRMRSPTWISTCVPEGKEDASEYGSMSVEYLMANIRDPVQFYGATRQIPPGAVLLEISSHSLFVSILRKSRPGPPANANAGDVGPVLGLIRRGNGSSRSQFLTCVGKLFQLGYNPDLNAIEGRGQIPVPVGTRMIAPLIKWDHSQTFKLMDYGFAASSARIEVDLSKEEYAFVRGHRIDRRILFPATGYLELAWAKLASMRGQQQESMAVEFSDVRYENPIIIREDTGAGTASFEITIASRNGGGFQFTTLDGLVLVRGNIRALNPVDVPKIEKAQWQEPEEVRGDVCLSAEDVYKLTRLAGFDYEGIFKGIHSINFGRNTSKIVWNHNWTAFLDTVLQLDIISDENVCIKVPRGIRKVVIDPRTFLARLEENMADIVFDQKSGLIASSGLQIHKLKVCTIPQRLEKTKPVLEHLRFMPYFGQSPNLDFDLAIKFFTDLLLENGTGNRMRVQENVDRVQNALAPSILKWVRCQPLQEAEIVIHSAQAPDADAEAWTKEQGRGIQVKLEAKGLIPKQGDLNLFVTNSIADLTSSSADAEQGPRFILLHTDLASVAIETVESYVCVAEKHVAGTSHHFALYGKRFDSKIPPTIVHVGSEDLGWIPKLQAALRDVEKAPEEEHRRVYIVGSAQPQSGIVGFMNCLRQEPAGRLARCIASPKPLPALDINAPGTMYTHVFEADLVMNLFEFDADQQQLGSYRHFPLGDSVRDALVETTSAYVNYETQGDLSTLKFFESSPVPVTDASRMCQVAFAALNFRDVMLATGKLRNDAVPGGFGDNECLLGLEFSGWDKNQRRVMGMLESRGLATQVLADPVFTWRVPEPWNLQEAATIPVAYSTAYYALIIRGGMRAGDSVLIHSGSGGVGQAAIAVALRMKCTVFTTVGSGVKREFLLSRFPQLDPDNIASSRDLAFERLVMERTYGRGVDLVLNSLTEEKLDASLRCLAGGGRFLEIGKYDLSQNRALGMEIFLRNISVHGILLDSLFDVARDRERIRELVQEGIDSGVVRPLPATVYGKEEIESAFRFMASGKHVGKVLVQMREEGCNVEPVAVTAVGRTYFDPSKVYIVIGGLGGFGFELARWMIEQRGCKKLILASRPGSGVKNGYQAWLIGCWARAGAWVKVAQVDLACSEAAESFLREAITQGKGPVGGIFNSAMVLRDRQFKNQTEDNFRAVMQPKLDAAVHLDKVTRQLCPIPELEHFVILSSFSSGRGVFGQTNYGWANAGMERICEGRRRDGLPGLAVQWGAIGDVGVVYDHMGGNDTNLYGMTPQRLRSCLSVLDALLRTGSSTSAVVTSWVLAKPKAASGPNSGGSAPAAAASGIIPMLCRIIGLTDPPTNRKLCLIDHGLDSLMAVETKQVLESYFNISLTTDEVRRLPWEKLAAMEGERKLND